MALDFVPVYESDIIQVVFVNVITVRQNLLKLGVYKQLSSGLCCILIWKLDADSRDNII